MAVWMASLVLIMIHNPKATFAQNNQPNNLQNDSSFQAFVDPIIQDASINYMSQNTHNLSIPSSSQFTNTTFESGKSLIDTANSQENVAHETLNSSQDETSELTKRESAHNSLTSAMASGDTEEAHDSMTSDPSTQEPSRKNSTADVVSALLDSLLENYDQNLRPNFGGVPLVVAVEFNIRSIGPITEQDMLFSMDCYFRQRWRDERLTFDPGLYDNNSMYLTLNVKILDRIWQPDTVIMNGQRSYLHTIPMPNRFFRIHADGLIYYSQRLTIRTRCPMSLEKFPLDSQVCPLSVGSWDTEDPSTPTHSTVPTPNNVTHDQTYHGGI